jgi:probable phosphoglycerate mutase
VKDINIYIVRHGEASISWGGKSDPGLSLQGKSQAIESARELAKFNSQALQLISSPKKRAMETAEPLGQTLKKPIKIMSEFDEIPSQKAKKKNQWLRRVAATHSSKLPNYLKDWQNQIIKQLLNIDADSIIFSHFMVINAVYDKLCNPKQFVSLQPSYTSMMHLVKRKDSLCYVSLSNENTSKIIV